MPDSPVAIVTAAGKGMGAAIARELSANGYRLALMSISGAAETLASELDALGVTGSVTEPDDLRRLVDATLDRHGRLDAVVNNTGHPPKGPLLELTDDDWRNGLELVLLGVVRMARLVTPPLKAAGGGAIVNISTFAAFEPSAAFPISATLRAALASYTKLYADAHAADGIRMNNVLPGYIDSFPADDELVRQIPMGRYGSVGEIGKTVRFLLSADAGYITGQNLRVDGGLTRSV
ncbi:MAG TPA: 3-oxoacyl-ACP reductase [Acidobacteria bacterium]|jgi:NAD(P)-dependent dehydrogenase (short-subunit alcohol dehydrogenase family)|nr:3-oxoacyl-ACP reductase [Acidobacteriota bacterium]|tara:strand:+ start:7608 stop:8312 length:705 start_codon:yes stop_codon:yes gene_type:complete